MSGGMVVWTDGVAMGAMGLWFLGLNLLWFLGHGAARRSALGWRLGTPLLLGLTGLVLGGCLDRTCTGDFGMMCGGVGVGVGWVLGWRLAGFQ